MSFQILRALVLSAILIGTTSCVSQDYFQAFLNGRAGSGGSGGSGSGGSGSGGNGGTSGGPVVCNPFGSSGGTVTNKNGLQASLTYIPAVDITTVNVNGSSTLAVGKVPLSTASFQPGQPSVVSEPTSIFLNQIDVPTVDFMDGFQDNTGHSLTDLNGNLLVEYFGLHVTGNIMLNATDTEGDFQLAVMSDDGSNFYIERPGIDTQFVNWVPNDGVHSNEFGCASTTVHLKPGVPLPIQADYFQGPRYRISYTLYWRTGASFSVQEPFCGVVEPDNFYYTQTTAGPAPTSNLNALLGRGWTPIPAANLYLVTGVTNPCP